MHRNINLGGHYNKKLVEKRINTFQERKKYNNFCHTIEMSEFIRFNDDVAIKTNAL